MPVGNRSWGFLIGYRAYVVAFLVFLIAPLLAAGAFAFNDSLFPSLPWQGFTLAWFVGDTDPKLGMLHDPRLLRGVYYSCVIALCVSALWVVFGHTHSLLLVRHHFPRTTFYSNFMD